MHCKIKLLCELFQRIFTRLLQTFAGDLLLRFRHHNLQEDAFHFKPACEKGTIMSWKLLSLRRIAYSLLGLGLLVGIASPLVKAQTLQGDSYVYVMTNKNPGNSVIQFKRSPSGALSWVAEVMTGGNGTGPNGPDPLGSQDSLVLSGDGHLLLAASSGSNEISAFRVWNGKLTWLAKTWSGGDFPNSIALYGDLVYVLNAKGANGNITGFRLDPNGFLHRIAGASVNLPPGSAGANDLRFAEDGTHLVMTVAGTNQLLTFDVGDNGIAGSPTSETAAGGKPFGIRFGQNGVAVVSEAAGSVSSYNFTGTGMLNVISAAVPDSQAASCWLSLSRSGQVAFVSNTGSGTISSYAVNGSGQVTLMAATAANPGGTPIDSTLSRNSDFLYVMDSAQGKLMMFTVSGGTLTPAGTMSIPAGSQGIAGL